MNLHRGEVVLVDFPFSSGTQSKLRPALVVQNDKDNARLATTVVVQITGTSHRSNESTQVLIEVGTPEGRLSGLAFDSALNCVNIVTVERARLRRRLGKFSVGLMQKANEALKTALGLQ
ncbi:MAG TPA: type II toxin-antitoxin system PemK/MazF family toxin [Tepidisphaeraceae bacterium]|jgi:mRNA interferase MazF|nr:type II toxin-antitoxin system PemK/MazF family toxin [Tepidisphaeraceae bacterium]